MTLCQCVKSACACASGRLLRAHGVEFDKRKLAGWVMLTEQWPYRLSWMILEVEDSPEQCEDNMTLKNLYERSVRRSRHCCPHHTGITLFYTQWS